MGSPNLPAFNLGERGIVHEKFVVVCRGNGEHARVLCCLHRADAHSFQCHCQRGLCITRLSQSMVCVCVCVCVCVFVCVCVCVCITCDLKLMLKAASNSRSRTHRKPGLCRVVSDVKNHHGPVGCAHLGVGVDSINTHY